MLFVCAASPDRVTTIQSWAPIVTRQDCPGDQMIKAIAILASVALLTSVSQPSAEVLVVTYTGTISRGFDRSGLFGVPRRDMEGDSYVARYTFDTSLGRTFSSPERNFAVGGSTLGIASPALSSTVTINGITHPVLSGNYYGQILGHNNGANSEQSHRAGFQKSAGNVHTSNDNLNYIRNYDGSLPASITAPFSHDVTPNDETYGYFRFSTYDYDTGKRIESTFGYVDLSNLTVELASAAPEPSALRR